MKEILFYYIPMFSSVAYMALALKITGAGFTNMYRIPTSVFIIFFGFTLYIYSRPHLKAVTTMKKVTYSVLGSLIFMAGSWVIISVARGTLVEERLSAEFVGVVSGAVILKLGYDYLKNSDKLVATIEYVYFAKKEHI